LVIWATAPKRCGGCNIEATDRNAKVSKNGGEDRIISIANRVLQQIGWALLWDVKE
jgi:hypothetical protein